MASPVGTPTQRVVAYLTEALAIRVVNLWSQIFCIAPPREMGDQMDDDNAMAFRLLNLVSLIPKFLHFTLNERLLRAFVGEDRVHIIDFNIKQGLQCPSLFQSLASRPNPPTHVRITGIGESKQDLQDTGARLAGFTEALNLPFEFHPVVDRLEDVRLWMLHVKERDCVAVNCILQLHKALYDESRGLLMDLLGLIQSTNPAIVLVTEQEAEHNEPRWEVRWANAMKYYSAIFDLLDSSLPKDSSARIKIKEMFARKIRNIMSCEGMERLERHESFNRWRKLMEDGGFQNVGIEERETLQSKMLLRMYPSQNYSIEKQGEADGLTLKWLEQPLYTVSAWAPLDIAVKEDKMCRVCHLSFDCFSQSSDLIQLGCRCINDLGAAHRNCAELWFATKGNRFCEICGEVATNISGVVDNGLWLEWNDAPRIHYSDMPVERSFEG